MSGKIEQKIGFIGCGNMGGAILHGIVASNVVDREQIYVYDVSEAKQEEMRTIGVHVMADNEQVCVSADIVILAVKPQYMAQTLASTKQALDGKCVISIAAGLSADQIRSMIDAKPRVLRTMPNTPAMVLSGAFALCSDCDLTDVEKQTAEALFAPLGIVEWVPEHLIDAVCGVSGSGPAYVAMFIEAMADAAVADGMPRQQAYTFAAQAVLGSAKMVLETGKHPGELKDMVCSPAGTTIEAVRVLEKEGMRSAVFEAMKACVSKSRGL